MRVGNRMLRRNGDGFTLCASPARCLTVIHGRSSASCPCPSDGSHRPLVRLSAGFIWQADNVSSCIDSAIRCNPARADRVPCCCVLCLGGSQTVHSIAITRRQAVQPPWLTHAKAVTAAAQDPTQMTAALCFRRFPSPSTGHLPTGVRPTGCSYILRHRDYPASNGSHVHVEQYDQHRATTLHADVSAFPVARDTCWMMHGFDNRSACEPIAHAHFHSS